MATYYVRPDGNDSNTGLGSTTALAWRTLQKALGATGIASGDTVYIAPGHYNETVTIGGTYSAETQIIGDPTASQFIGVNAGIVKHSQYPVTNNSAINLTQVVVGVSKNFLHFKNIYFEIASQASAYSFTISGRNNKLTSCVFVNNQQVAPLYPDVQLAGVASQNLNAQINTCIFYGTRYVTLEGFVAAGDASSITNSVFLSTRNEAITLSTITCSIYNCTVINGGQGIRNYAGTTTTVRNCLISNCTTGINNAGTFNIDYSRLTGNTSTVTNSGSYTAGSNVVTAGVPGLEFGYSLLHNLVNQVLFGSVPNSPNVSYGVTSGAPTTDLFGVAWSGTSPDAGAITNRSIGAVGQYLPTERNASTITIAPGSTSQSIELYLGSIGLTASTAGLSARYNRTRTASVSIPLVARTIAQAWTAGGFAEVDATNMPGVYRLDLPDAALAAGADDVTIVVRGASGTNGAVMTIKLSSGGLTSAQTASAVWGADVAGYVTETNFGGVVNATRNVSGSTEIIAQDIPSNVWEELTTNHTTHNTFGWNILRADAQSKQGLVTLASSGGTNRVDADIHAIVNDTAAAAELKGALLHTGGDYITADLQTPITSTVSPAIGPFTVLPSGAGADNIVDLNVGSALPLVLNLQDGTGAPFNASGATITATVYTAGGSTVTTYTGSIIAGYIGAISVPLSTAVTATSATYTMLVSVVIGTTTTVFGPLKLVVRAI